MQNKIIGFIVCILVFTSLAGAINTNDISIQSEKKESANAAHTHIVLSEFGTYTTCIYCKYAHEALIYLFFNRGDDYPFYYVTHVYDVNVWANSRVKGELGLTSSPTVYWDGGWKKDIGSPSNTSAVAAYKKSINMAKNRTVADIDLSVDGYWLGAVNNEPENGSTKVPIEQIMNWTNSEFVVNVSVANNEASQYNGHIHVYVCDIKSSMGWWDTHPRLYTMTFLDYAFNNNTALGAESTWESSANWDGMDHTNGTHLFEYITENNTMLIASIFDRDNDDYSDETAGYRLGEGTDPKTFTVYFGNTTPPPVAIENISVMSYQNESGLEWNTTYYWRVDVWPKEGKKTKGDRWSFTTRDNHPPRTPNNPDPWNNSDNIPINTNLTWRGGDPDGDEVVYDLYMSKDYPPPLLVEDHNETMYDLPLDLEYETKYYWKIVAKEVKYNLTTSGPIWNFITEANRPPNKAKDPIPPNGSGNVPKEANLSWNGTDPNPGDILKYDVYFGRENPPPKVSSNQSDETYNPPGDMEEFKEYFWKIVTWDKQEEKAVGDLWNFTTGLNDPPTPPEIDGAKKGKAGEEYQYTFTSEDPLDENVSYQIDWGDGSKTDWTKYQLSGSPYRENHTWIEIGEYTISARARDIYEQPSDWSYYEVTMPKNKPFNIKSLFLIFLERHPNIFPVLRQLIETYVV